MAFWGAADPLRCRNFSPVGALRFQLLNQVKLLNNPAGQSLGLSELFGVICDWSPLAARAGDINEAVIALGLVLQLNRCRACLNDRNGMRSAALLHLDGEPKPFPAKCSVVQSPCVEATRGLPS
jgi:hypothetical protein